VHGFLFSWVSGGTGKKTKHAVSLMAFDRPSLIVQLLSSCFSVVPLESCYAWLWTNDI